LKEHIIERFEKINREKLTKDAESVMIFFDLLSCPYLTGSGAENNVFKKRILSLFGVEACNHESFLNYMKKQRFWFTKWTNFKLEKEINSKISQEVYS